MPPHVHVESPDTPSVEALIAGFQQHGFVTFGGVRSHASFVQLARRILDVTLDLEADSGTTAVDERLDECDVRQIGDLTRGDLALHTEGSALSTPPALMMLFCAEAAASGGSSRLFDSALLHRILAHDRHELLDALSAPTAALFGDSPGLYAPVFDTTGDRTRVRFRDDALVQFSPAVTPHLPYLRHHLHDLEIQIHLVPGSGYLLDNHRWLHGRSAFQGQRTMYRLLGEPLAERPIATGFIRQKEVGGFR